MFPRLDAHVRATAGQARPSCAGARDPRALGERAHVRTRARAQPGRNTLELRGRADHGERDDGRPPRVGPLAQGPLPALQGAARLPSSRYQNGFDCQGLWVEVNVERALGLNSKREIEEYGLGAFADRCRESVAMHAERITEQSARLGMWMDWDNDYYTFSDTNIEYIWRFLKTIHERGWLYLGHRSNVWCPRCGTSISQHELIGSYEDRSDPSLYVRFPLARPPGRVARRLDDHALDAAGERGRRREARRRVRPERGRQLARRRALPGRDLRAARSGATSSSGSRTRARSTSCRRPAERRAPRDRLGRGDARRGHRHRPHRARLRRRGLRARRGRTTCPC